MNTDDLIDKLFRGLCTQEELAKLARIIETLPRKEADRVMEELWKQITDYPEMMSSHTERMYNSILSKIEVKDTLANSEKGKTVSLPQRRRQLLQIASVAVILLITGISVWFWSSRTNEMRLSTDFAEQQTYTLPDGSTVVLNANSTLRYRDDWNQTEDRQVWIDGEAFFDIVKKPATGQIFQVITNDLAIDVLGTSFNVNSHHKQTKVYLEEGKIALTLKHQPEQRTIMEPGDLLTYSAVDERLISDNNKTSQNLLTSWRNGVIVFDNTPLKDVLLKIEEIYGIKIQVQNEAHYDRKLTTGLPMNELKLVLPMLESSLNLKIIKEDNLYVIE
ncbi:MAG: FecR domain-containing protein [Bacteroidota bacterium]